ncbi:hypothetical protein NBRC116188_00610 [Oceaniserpentilla sp. 4NH20-0058]|uniref:hypothetical protein n=1 Tax=Oceaniserpentilla sp. 4NH20-0058 TaxID=3127660 RepID=UPI00310A44CC
MSVWVVIAVVALVVVGSVVWVRPSPRDQKLAKWRGSAIMAGLKVRMQTLKAEPKNSGIRDDVEGITYEWYNPKPDKSDQLTWAVVKTDGWLKDGLPDGWSWYSTESKDIAEQIAEIIEQCPVEVNALERTPRSSRVIWNENGKEFNPEQLRDYLETLQAIS